MDVIGPRKDLINSFGRFREAAALSEVTDSTH